MHLYHGTSTEFVEEATHNRIAERLREGWFRHHRFYPAESEVRSWRNSLARMADAVRLAGLEDHGVICEYQLPLTSRRLDVMITGHNEEGRPLASLVELKQWDDAGPSHIDEVVTVWVGGGIREVLHPSVQVTQYREYLADTHEAFSSGKMGIRSAAYLHNFMFDEGHELYDPRHARYLAISPLFAGDQIDDLAVWLRDGLSGGRGVLLIEDVLHGRYRPNKKLLDHTARMIKREPTYTLLDEQKVAFNSVLAAVADAHSSGQKTTFLIRGGPGTGKSVLAVNLLAELSAAGYSTHHTTGSKAFTENLRKSVGRRAAQQFKYFNSYVGETTELLDVLIADEAHRVRETSASRFTPRDKRPDRPQIEELMAVARVTVFFLDDLQAVRPGEIGHSDLIRSAAQKLGIPIKEYELDAQFRAGGSDEYISWVDNTIAIRRTEHVIWDPAETFDVDVVDSPEELRALIQHKASEGHTARLVAGFCWPWSDPLPDGTLVDDVRIGSFAMPWNAKHDRRTAPGIPKADLWATDPDGIHQIGCIYTAQGFEFDYVGVIFGRDLVYRFGEGWVGDPSRSHDTVVKRAAKQGIHEFTRLVKQTYRVLMTRGLKGAYFYFEDDQTRDFIMSRIEKGSIEEVGSALR